MMAFCASAGFINEPNQGRQRLALATALAALVGQKQAADLILTGRSITGTEAARIDLANTTLARITLARIAIERPAPDTLHLPPHLPKPGKGESSMDDVSAW